MSRYLRAAALALLVSSSAAAAEPLWFDFSPSPLSRLLKQAEKRTQLLRCPRAPAPPAIDGRLDDAAWRNAAVIERFTIARPVSRARLCFDDRALYIGVECSQVPGRSPEAKTRPRDGNLFSDDCIEVWFDPTRKGKLRYQFAINAAGSIYDQIIRKAAEYPAHNPGWTHAVQRGKDRWTVEMAIPLTALQLTRWPKRLGFNIGRNGPGLQPHAWNADYGDTSTTALQLEGVPERPPEATGTPDAPAAARTLSVSGESLRIVIEKPVARPGDRWTEVKLNIYPVRTALDKTQVKATVFALGRPQPAAKASAVPERNSGILWVDLRQLGMKEARVCIEVFEENQRTATAEAFLSARDCTTPLQPGQKINIEIDPPQGIDEVKAHPVTFGVPFPAGALWDTGRLRLTDSAGREIPSQKEVTGLWAREGAIKWVRFDALVSSKDGCLVEVASPAAGSTPKTPLRVNEQGERLVIDTGVARYVLGKGPSPIQEIWLGSQRVATSSGTRGLYVVDQKDRVAQASTDGETMEIEARGPVAACVRFEGFYRTPAGEQLARHITRVEAFAGQSFANITHTLVLTNDTNKVWFKDIGWEFTVDPGADPRAVFGIARDEWAKSVTQALNFTSASAFMIQDSHFRFAHGKNHYYVARTDSVGKAKQIAEGEECGDWALLAGKQAGLTVSCREAARQHPKEFEVFRNKIVLHLFSSRAGEQLDFRAPALVKRWNLTNWYNHVLGKSRRTKQEDKVKKYTSNAIGWAKTHQLRLAPLPPREPAPEAARLSRLLAAPVCGHVDPQWIYRTLAMNRIHPRDTDRFPEAEKVIQETIKVWERRVHEWGDYGFIDYFAGPHLEYSGKYVRPYRYCGLTYTLRGDLWLAYARSGDWNVRAFAAATNRTYMDIHFCHWDGNGKVRGLYVSPPGGGASDKAGKGCLPFYWEGTPATNASSSTGLHNFTLDYYLTGYRRAKDHVLEYADGIKRFWTPAKARRDWRSLMTMRMAIQAYAFNWDPELRAIAEATTDVFSDAEGELGLTKNRPYTSSTYKTQVDIAALLDAWEILGHRRYHDLSMKVARYWWPRFLAGWPIFYCSPIGRINNFLYYETGDPCYAQVLAAKLRQAGTAYNPKTGVVINHNAGRVGAEDATFVFQGIPFAEDVLVRTNADKSPVASWISYEDFGYPTAIVLRKDKDDVAVLDLQTPRLGDGIVGSVRVEPVQPPNQMGLDLIRIQQQAGGATTIRIPKDAPEGAYKMVPSGQGTHFAMAHSQRPLVLHAPEYWQPAPMQAPPRRWYFNVPKDSKDAQIFFESAAKLFDPEGNAWLDGKPVQGWIDLLGGKPGLWSFEPVEKGLVRVRNLPPFFAAESPESYFTPQIPWAQEEIPTPPEKLSPDTVYVPGAVNTPGNKALYLQGRRTFRLNGGDKHPSGDGPRFLPFKQGTIEFFYKPDWGTFDIEAKRKRTSKYILTITSSPESWRLFYMKSPNPTRWSQSHLLYAMFVSGGKRRLNIRSYRQTVIEPHTWVHIAWTWGTEAAPNFRTNVPTEVFTARVFFDGKLGRSWSSRYEGQHPADLPKALALRPDAAYDELRISDVPRYTGDFTPPSRDREFKLDEHTRALFHFNGDIQGRSHGHTGPLPVELKP